MPVGIAQFLRHRRTSWECFCGAVEECATPVHFVSTTNGFTKAVCCFCSNKCGFSINLNETCHTAHHISTYKNWPMFQAAANTATLVTRFELQWLNSPLCYLEIAPYFMDYLGAHRSIYPSQTWTRTVSAIPAHINNNRHHHFAVFPTARDQLLGHAHHPVQHPMQHVEPDALIVTPEDVPDLPMVQEGPILSPNEQEHLFKLAAGGGIHKFDADCLLEKCDGCRRCTSLKDAERDSLLAQTATKLQDHVHIQVVYKYKQRGRERERFQREGRETKGAWRDVSSGREGKSYRENGARRDVHGREACGRVKECVEDYIQLGDAVTNKLKQTLQ
ncbi:hypothetical protein BDR03DRAFT_982210 [Suillus americanus]|nr:hypothetical protein BDR03DRAFT_982210 [Suillus americanus]